MGSHVLIYHEQAVAVAPAGAESTRQRGVRGLSAGRSQGAVRRALSPSGSGSAYDRYVEAVNHSRLAITSFHASNTASDSWEEDMLGSGVLAAGHQVRIDLDDGGSSRRFDLRTRFADGTIVIRRDVDVCSAVTYTLTN